jgi:hypothetical protein
MAYTNSLHNHGHSSESNHVTTIFPHRNPKHETIFEYTNPNFKSVTNSPETYTKTWFCVPQEEFIETHCITHAYTKILS